MHAKVLTNRARAGFSHLSQQWQAFGYGVLPGGDVDEVEIPSNIDVNTLV